MSTPIFLAGKNYQVVTDFKSGSWNFAKGEVLQFEKGGYSPYDDCYIYEFLDAFGQRKNWIVSMESPAGAQEKFFREI